MRDVKEELAAALAHEVKNPVSLIKANIDIIRTSNSVDCDKNFEVINREIKKIDTLINDFTSLSRSSTKENMERVFIEDLINDVIEDYDVSLKRRKIHFEILSRVEDISLYGDYNKLCILFFNIIKNAVEAIEDSGNISVKIDELKEEVEVEVIDDGMGIDDNMLGVIGKPFVTSKEDGCGLGIAICKSIVEEHGGRLEIANAKNGGCSVKVRLKKSN